jgi:hypothetical protein
VDSGALEPLAACLEEFDPSVKEAASWALGYIARHNTRTFLHTHSLMHLLHELVILLTPFPPSFAISRWKADIPIRLVAVGAC